MVKLASESLMKNNVFIYSQGICPRDTYLIKKIKSHILQQRTKLGRHHPNQVIKVINITPVMEQIDIMCLLISCTEKDTILLL